MPSQTTLIGGAAREFPATSWSVVLGAAAGGEPSRVCLERLIGLYWKPVYWYIRRCWRRANEEAKDLTQEYFSLFIEGQPLLGFAGRAQSFRGFVRSTLHHFLCKRARDGSRLKRSGSRRLVPLDADSECGLEVAAEGLSPEEAFDRAWAQALLADVIASIEESYAASGRAAWFEVFRRHDLAPAPTTTYRETASALGVSEHDVQNRLRHVRLAVRQALVERARETVLDPSDVAAELSALFGA